MLQWNHIKIRKKQKIINQKMNMNTFTKEELELAFEKLYTDNPIEATIIFAIAISIILVITVLVFIVLGTIIYHILLLALGIIGLFVIIFMIVLGVSLVVTLFIYFVSFMLYIFNLFPIFYVKTLVFVKDFFSF